jgi:hypothetical protein
LSIIIRGKPSRFGITSHLDTNLLCNKIGLNPGNLAFTYANALILGFPKQCDWLDPVETGESVGVYVVANELGQHFYPTDFCHFLENTPSEWGMIVIGLGAQGPLNRLSSNPDEVQIHEGHLDWLRLMIEKSPSSRPNIALRGEYTRQLLEKHSLADAAIVTGCPSFMLSPLKDLGQQIARRFEIIGDRPLIHGALGNPWCSSHQSFEQGLLRIVTSTGGVAHVQMINAHIALSRGDDLPEKTLEELRGQMVPHLMVDDVRDWGRRHLQAWWDAPAWMEYLRRADFLFGSRIHGVMMALQAGVPAMCAVHDSRTQELCEAMDVPNVSLYDEPWANGNFNWGNIRAAFERQFDPSTFDRLRHKRAAQFRDLFISHGVEVSPHLHNLAN